MAWHLRSGVGDAIRRGLEGSEEGGQGFLPIGFQREGVGFGFFPGLGELVGQPNDGEAIGLLGVPTPEGKLEKAEVERVATLIGKDEGRTAGPFGDILYRSIQVPTEVGELPEKGAPGMGQILL